MIGQMLALGAGAAFLAGCAGPGTPETAIQKEPFGTTPDGQAVEIYTLRNDKGAEARIMTYGGTVLSLKMPDRKGHYDDVVLGFDNLDDYLKGVPYFGALIGRYGNRIGNAKFSLDGQTYNLVANDGPNTLHGGTKGFDKVVWTAKPHMADGGAMLELDYVSPDGEQGFPGTLTVTAVYTLTEENELRLDFMAATDKDTVVNLTHHSYWNLAGKGDILNHVVSIYGDYYTPVDAGLIPTGKLEPVSGTPFDFRAPTVIGTRVNQDDPQLKLAHGIDHNWVIEKAQKNELTRLARVSEPTTGRVMEVWSTEPAVQFYTGNFLNGTLKGKGGWVYQKNAAICLEPQHYPDSPNQPQFPGTELKPGELFQSTIIYKFTAE